ncbi:MAG: RNA polymerase sporulation sigma factor SigE [Clostridiales bacterium]|nr:RNA polymerase sporulation sigma factor SigE [Clostridiales bacterium]
MIIIRLVKWIFRTIKRLFGLILLKFSSRRKGGVFYINGTDVLPAPLTQEEEAEAIKRVMYDNSVKAILIEHNLRLVVYIAKKFENTGIGIEDLISIGTIGLIKAINTFKSDKNIKLATYASRCIENEILMYIRKSGAQRCEISIDEPLNIDWDGNELLLSDILGSDEDIVYHDIESDEERKIIRQAVAHLDERERIIIELRYGLLGGSERTQKEVADMLGISQSYISRLEKRIISRLRREVGAKI